MRSRVLHPTGLVVSSLKILSPAGETSPLDRCLKHLWKNILPTMLILVVGSLITMYLGGLIDRAKLDHEKTGIERTSTAGQKAE